MSLAVSSPLTRERSLAVNEIFFSIQGESTQAGRPCAFVRLMGCPLRCSYCDTEYAFYEGRSKTFDDIIAQLNRYPSKLVELTGGEPLAQPRSIPFMEELVSRGFEVLLETSGALSVEGVPKEVRIIMDLKTPSSGESQRNYWDNLGFLKEGVDEIKFVVGDREDFNFLLESCRAHRLPERFAVLVSPVFGKINLEHLAGWVLDSGYPLRMQVQMHKLIWGEKRGV